MTSTNRNHRSPANSRTKANDAELWSFFDLCLNKRLSKQWRGWWFQTPSCPLWRQCNVHEIYRMIYCKSFAAGIKFSCLHLQCVCEYIVSRHCIQIIATFCDCCHFWIKSTPRRTKVRTMNDGSILICIFNTTIFFSFIRDIYFMDSIITWMPHTLLL